MTIPLRYLIILRYYYYYFFFKFYGSIIVIIIFLFFYIIGHELFKPMTSLKPLTIKPILVIFYFFIYVD